MFEDMLAAGITSLVDIFKRVTVSKDSNMFPPETNKLIGLGVIKRKKMWVVCDNHGKMYFRHIQDPLDLIKDLSKLKDKGKLTEEEFQQGKAAALRQLGDNSDETTDTAR